MVCVSSIIQAVRLLFLRYSRGEGERGKHLLCMQWKRVRTYYVCKRGEYSLIYENEEGYIFMY